MQGRDESDVGVLGERVAQCERAVGGTSRSGIGRTPSSSSGGSGAVSPARDRRRKRPGLGAGPSLVIGAVISAVLGRRHRDLVFGPDIPAFEPQDARAVDADKCAGAGDLGGGVDDGALVKCGQRRLDLGEAVIDLFRDVVRLGVGLFQFVELDPEGLVSGRLFGERALLSDQTPQIVDP